MKSFLIITPNKLFLTLLARSQIMTKKNSNSTHQVCFFIHQQNLLDTNCIAGKNKNINKILFQPKMYYYLH
jgi:hypothetical protein